MVSYLELLWGMWQENFLHTTKSQYLISMPTAEVMLHLGIYTQASISTAPKTAKEKYFIYKVFFHTFTYYVT
jgi:hypothetical protein